MKIEIDVPEDLISEWFDKKNKFNDDAKFLFEHLTNKFSSIELLRNELDSEGKCHEYLAQLRWNGTPACPGCGSVKVYKLSYKHRYKCGEKECKKDFTATVGTIFEGNKMPLQKKIVAAYKIRTLKEKVNSIQLSKELGITQKSSWWTINKYLWIILDRLPKLAYGIKGNLRGGKRKEILLPIVKKKPEVFNFENAIYWLEDKIFDSCKAQILDYNNARMLQSEVYEYAWMHHHEFNGNNYDEFEQWIHSLIKDAYKKFMKEFGNDSKYQQKSLVHKFDDGNEVTITVESIAEDDLEYNSSTKSTVPQSPYSTVTKSAEVEYVRKETYFNTVLNSFIESNYSLHKLNELTHAYCHLIESEFDFSEIKERYNAIFREKIGVENIKLWSKPFQTNDDWIKV